MNKLTNKFHFEEKKIPLDNNYISKNNLNMVYEQKNSMGNSQNNISRIELLNKNKILSPPLEKINNRKMCSKIYIGSEYHHGLIFIFFFLIKYFLSIYFLEKKLKIKIIESILLLISLIFCLFCIFSSPGILPPNIDSSQNEVKKNYKNSSFPYKFKEKLILIRGQILKLKVCSTCLITRPLGSTHCSKCNICIEKMDHHCPYVGNCLGLNNYKYFFYFICFFDIHTIFNFVICILRIIDFKKKIEIIISSILAFINIITISFVSALIYNHTTYIILGETAYMRLKYKTLLILYGNKKNKGFKENCNKIFCRKYKPKQILKKELMFKPFIYFNIRKNKFYNISDPLGSFNNLSKKNNNTINKIINNSNDTFNHININYYISNNIIAATNRGKQYVLNVSKSYEEDKGKNEFVNEANNLNICIGRKTNSENSISQENNITFVNHNPH